MDSRQGPDAGAAPAMANEAPTGNQGRGESAGKEDWRYRCLLDLVDLIGLHTDLDELLPDLATCLAQILDFDAAGLVLPHEGGQAAELRFVVMTPGDGHPSACRADVVPLPPLHQTRLASLWGKQSPVVLHALENDTEYPELSEALRAHGDRSACLLPLTTALRPVGLLGLASAREGAYDGADLAFLQRAASQVAVAIDNVRHHQQAAAYHRQLEADRDHWRTLLEVNNALVSNLDLASLLSALTPNLRNMVPHDYTSLVLVDAEHERLGLYAMDPALPATLVQAVSSVKPEKSPFAAALAARKPLELDPAQIQTALPETMRKSIGMLNVNRICFLPLFTPRKVLGGLTMARRSSEPFGAEEMERA
jgi:formate hydrogenlyase transcriptional activator